MRDCLCFSLWNPLLTIFMNGIGHMLASFHLLRLLGNKDRNRVSLIPSSLKVLHFGRQTVCFLGRGALYDTLSTRSAC